MSQDLIRYDLLAQEALRGVVRRVLIDVARAGILPGNHHFYIAFDTQAPGVRVSARLREKYPEEMTVVLQHQFWDLNVTEHAFEVGLSFGNLAERLYVPFDSIKGFFDPSVQFGLQFEVAREGEPVEVEPGAAKQDNEGGQPAEVMRAVRKEAKKQAEKKEAAAKDNETGKDGAEGDEATEGDAAQGADVVSLDAFRKKT